MALARNTLTVVVALCCLAGPARAQPMAETSDSGRSRAITTLAPMLERVLPGVVSILVTGERRLPVTVGPAAKAQPAAMNEPFRSGGSGVIVDADKGIILTNHHVIVDATRIDVALSDGRTAVARLIGSDIATDVAVIAIPPGGLTTVPFGDSDKLRIGDFICAVGSPFGLDGSASQGIVSALMRTDIGYEIFEDFIQIDAAVNPGNSGGALVDLAGRLVGINTATGSAKLRTQGISFAIPINMARAIAAELIDKGHFKRGALGFVTENLGFEMAQAMNLMLTRGAAVTAVLPDSPAAKAGARKGDVIVSIDGKPVRGQADYNARVATTSIGRTLRIGLVSGGARKELNLVVADFVVPPTPERAPMGLTALHGLTLGAVLPGFKSFGRVQGARVLAVSGGIESAGFEPDDVITKVDMTAVRSPSDVFDAAGARMGRYRFEVYRDGATLWIWGGG
ncbi:MAG: trypsin-like peptidase domain-containing protein [Hyphomicrobiaceae bacterium]|nr:trypsin-like peptidase domain-containing protein [Hyphomicrobiaceae bacterium]